MEYREFDYSFDMEALIDDRLKEISNLEERILGKKLLREVFLALYQETEKKYAALEQRVYQEMESDDTLYSIYSTVIPRQEIDPAEAFMFPMLDSDNQPPLYDWEEIRRQLAEGEPVYMLRVFLEDDYLSCQALIEGKRQFEGRLHADSGYIGGRFQLVPTKAYQDLIYQLYQLFINNHKQWVTVNNPYLHKFFDVQLLELQEPLPEATMVSGLDIDFEELSPRIRYEMVPLWNLHSFTIGANDFPVPCEDHINVEHYIDISEQGLHNGYLVDTEKLNISDCRRQGDYLVLVTSVTDFYDWEVCKVVSRPAKSLQRYPYPIFGNYRRDSFIKRSVQVHGQTIKTKAELLRLIEEFALDEYLIYQDIKITEAPPAQIETYEMNTFIKDELRDEEAKRWMLIDFKAQKEGCCYNQDLMSFLVSQIQLSYPEFRCVGRLSR